MNSHNRRKVNNPIKKKIQADDLHKISPKKDVQVANIYEIGSLSSLILTYCLMLSHVDYYWNEKETVVII